MTPTPASPGLAGGRALPRSRWARLGLAGFLFFLVKGLLWLVVPAVLWLAS